MQTTLTGRHVEITDALRGHIDKRLEKLSSYGDRIIDVRVVLSVEKYRQFAEVTVSGRGNTKFHGHEATDDMYVSVDKAIEKVERQLKRHMSKRRSTQRRKEDSANTFAEGSAEEPSDPGQLIETYGEFRVSVSDDFPPKPMSVEEALTQLEASEGAFRAFVNEETDEVNVVYRKEKGGYGLLRRSF
jgi:putative sigma-54 modulation protein